VQERAQVRHRIGPQRPRERRRGGVEIVAPGEVQVLDQARFPQERQEQHRGGEREGERASNDRQPAARQERRHGDDRQGRLRRQQADDHGDQDSLATRSAPLFGDRVPVHEVQERGGGQGGGLTQAPATQRGGADENHRHGDGWVAPRGPQHGAQPQQRPCEVAQTRRQRAERPENQQHRR